MADFKEILVDGQVYKVKDETAREDAGSGGYEPPQGGIPKTDLATAVQESLNLADSSLQPSDRTQLQGAITQLQNALNTLIGSGNVQGVIDTFNEVVAFLNGINSSDTLAAKLAQIQQSIPSVDGFVTEGDVEDMIDDALEDLPTGSVESVTINGTKHTPDANGDVDLGTIQGEKGDKGDTVVLDPSQVEQFDIINGLNAAAAGNALDAYQGKRLKDQIDYVYARLQAVYAALGNIAFWDGKPAAATILPSLDWGNPKHTVTLDLTLTNAVVKHNGVVVSDGDTIQVEEYATLTLTVEAASGYTLNSVASQVGTVSQDLSTVTLVMGQSNVTLDITAVAVAVYSISYGTMTNCSVAQGSPTSISGSSVQIQFSVDSGYELLASNITVTNADKSFNSATNVLTISNPTGNVSISATASVPTLKFLKGRFLNANGIHDDAFYQAGDQSSHPENYCEVCVVSDYIKVPEPSTPSTSQPLFSVCWARTLGSSTQYPSQWQLYRKETNGTYTYLDRRAWDPNGQTKKDRGGSNPDIIDAWNAGTLYVRTTLTLTSASANTIHTNCYLKQGSIVLFNNSTPYTLVLPEDWTIDDLTNGNE